MRVGRLAHVAVSALPLLPGSVPGQEVPAYRLTFERALEIAHERAPRVTAGRAGLDVARAERVGAAVRQSTNPELAAALGPRWQDVGRSLDVEASLSQRFDLGGERGARLDAADAAIEIAAAEADESARELLYEVSTAFLRGLHTGKRLEIATENLVRARELGRIAAQRYEAGEVGGLDVGIASVADGHATSEARRLEAERIAILGELRALLGIEPEALLELEGELGRGPRLDLDSLLARAAARADIRALEAGIRQAEAEMRLARGLAWPDLGLEVQYVREEGDDALRGGATVELPVFDRGQGLGAAASARARALRARLEALRRSVEAGLRTAHAAYRILEEAAAEFEGRALPAVEQTLRQARRSYELGNIPLAELLVLQGEMIEASNAYADLLLERALAAVRVRALAGSLP